MTNMVLIAYDLAAPMSWHDFLQLPRDYQAAYLDRLIGRFGVTDDLIADMFKIHVNTFRVRRKYLDVEPSYYGRPTGGILNPADVARWREWLQTSPRTRAMAGLIEKEHPEVTVL